MLSSFIYYLSSLLDVSQYIRVECLILHLVSVTYPIVCLRLGVIRFRHLHPYFCGSILLLYVGMFTPQNGLYIFLGYGCSKSDSNLHRTSKPNIKFPLLVSIRRNLSSNLVFMPSDHITFLGYLFQAPPWMAISQNIEPPNLSWRGLSVCIVS